MINTHIKKPWLTRMVTVLALQISPMPSLWQATPVYAQTNTIPAAVQTIENLSFASFASVMQEGEFIATTELTQILGWNPSTRWKTGDTLIDFMPIGHFDNLGIGDMSLRQIMERSLTSLPSFSLNNLGVIRQQTLLSLLESMPELEGYRIASLPVIDDALTNITQQIPSTLTIRELLWQYRDRLNVNLTELIDLSRYSVSNLPGVLDLPLKQFPRWQELKIAEIPGLATVPFAAFPKPLVTGNLQIAYADIVLNQYQNQLNRSIVGSYKEGFNVSCQRNCPHIEFSQPEWLSGAQWISGQTLKVKGGKGILGAVNDGKEPAGRHPFGANFKVVLWDVDEAGARGEMAIFFRFCLKKTFVNLGCTPYFIGPVPFFPIHEKSWTPI